jgi:hypothetical protein
MSTLPTNLWEDKGDERRLVLNGALSTVFHVSGQGLTSLLEDSTHFQGIGKHDSNWNAFVSGVDTFLQDNSNAEARFYLKIRSKDTCFQNKPMRAMFEVWGMFKTQAVILDDELQVALDLISVTYPLKPYGNADLGVILMRDRGRPLTDISVFKTNILSEFKKIIRTATFLSKHLPHGDVLPHNLVYDEANGHLTLIDLDEGVASGELANHFSVGTTSTTVMAMICTLHCRIQTFFE